MQLSLTPDQELFRSTTERFLAETAPLETIRERAADADGFDPAWWARAAELGWTALLVPEELGGGSISGEGLKDLALVAEEFGKVVAPGPLVPTNIVASAIARASNVADHTDTLEAVLGGEAIVAWCVSGTSTAWDAQPVALTATAKGDSFVLEGVADYVEAGNQATLLLVTARTDEGVTQFLVPVQTAGVVVEPLNGLDMVRRYARIRFDAVQVPASAVLGEVGGAQAELEHQLQIAAVLQAAETCGLVGRVFDFTLQWLFDRYSFGRPLASYQSLKHRFAEDKLWLEACYATTDAAIAAISEGSEEAAELADVASAFVGEKSTVVIQDCVQMHGGLGVTWEHDLHLYLRRATLNRVTYGTVEEHRRLIVDRRRAARA